MVIRVDNDWQPHTHNST